MGCVLDESGTDRGEYNRKVASGRVEGAIRSLVNAGDLQLECARVLHETLLVLVLAARQCYGKSRRDLELRL